MTSRKVCSLCASKPWLSSACLLRFSASETLSVYAQLFSHIRYFYSNRVLSLARDPSNLRCLLSYLRKLSVERCLYSRKPPISISRTSPSCFHDIRELLLEPGTFTRSFESAMPPKKRFLSAKAKRYGVSNPDYSSRRTPGLSVTLTTRIKGELSPKSIFS